MRMRLIYITICLLALFSATTFSQPTPKHDKETKTAEPEKSAIPAPDTPTAIPLADVAIQLETRGAQLRDIEERVPTHSAPSIEPEFKSLVREVESRTTEQNKILAQRPSLEIVRALERGWQRVDETLNQWTNDLAKSIAELSDDAAFITKEEKTWTLTRETAREEAPPEVVQRIGALLSEIERVNKSIDSKRSQILALHNRVTLQSARVNQARLSVKTRRDEIVDRVFHKDSPPLWNAPLLALARQSLARDTIKTLSAQLITLNAYGQREAGRFFLHAILYVFLATVLWWLKKQSINRDATTSPSNDASHIFRMPFATALVLTAYASMWVYPLAPRLLWTIVGLLALIPTVLILRHRIPRILVPALYAIMFFYTVDQTRAIAASLDAVPRLLFVAEMVGGTLFLIWFVVTLRSNLAHSGMSSVKQKLIQVAALAALMFCVCTGAANIFGYVTLSNLLGNAILSSAYYGVILTAIVLILNGIIAVAFSKRPFILSKMVGQYSLLLSRRIAALIFCGAFTLWGLFFLDRLAIRDRILDVGKTALTSQFHLGSVAISLGDILLFALTVWSSFAISRFVQFFLQEDVYPRARLARGLPYAISKALHYTILLSGFLLAVAALGFDMTKFTILAGAFTVGVGFGLQNIFNNFVSGIILLFERPVQVGDLIQMDDVSGIVDRIGIRASVVRANNGSEIIVPNGKLISERLVNWTFSNQQRSVEVPVSVSHGADPKQVIQLINQAATAHPQISTSKPPQTLLTRMGPDWLGFELRAWTDTGENWVEIRSDLAIAICEALTNAKIALK